MLMRVLAGAVLLCVAAPAWAQPRPAEGLGRCGGRPGVRYAAVFDASSSLREDDESRGHTVREYTRVLRLLSGLLCDADSLSVHAFAADRERRMAPLHVITAANRSAATLRDAASRAIDARTTHTDLHLSLRGIRADIFPDPGVLAVFLMTDGSFYPHAPSPADRTADGLRDRLDALASLADSLRDAEVAHPGHGRPAPRLFAIGVRSDDAWAIDRALDPTFPDAQGARLWRRGSTPVDLRDHKGSDLLSAVFAERFSRLDDLSLWRILLATPDGLWSRRFGYATGWGFPLQRLQHLAARHLLFLPPSESMECPVPAHRGEEEPGYTSMAASVQGRPVCSLERPSRHQLAELGDRGVKEFAILQGGTHEPVLPLSPMHGLHQFVLADSGKTCEIATVAAQFDHGEPWPPREAVAVAQVWTVPLGAAGEEQDQPQEMNLIRLPRSHCLIPGFTGTGWERPRGKYAIFVRQSGGTTVYAGTFEPPPVRITEQFVRPAGFPLPANELALVRVCVRRGDRLATDEQMWIWLQGKELPLTLERARARCRGRSGEDGGYLYGFSGLALLDGSDIGTARIFIGRRGDGLRPMDADVWVPLQLTVDGKLFLSWRGLILVFLLGFGLQFVYLWWCTEPGREQGFSILFRLTTLTSGTLSGILVCVAAEFWKMVREADISADKVPVLFALSILAHMMKILAAALIPEHVEESLFD